jgi:hypothetical protein
MERNPSRDPVKCIVVFAKKINRHGKQTYENDCQPLPLCMSLDRGQKVIILLL